MEILDLRHFSSMDLRPLLDQEIESWGRLLSWDYSSSAEMILRYVDSKILPGYAAVDRGQIVGYAFFVYEGNKGVVGDLFVGSSGRASEANEIETRLLTHVIETLQQSPGIHRVEAQLLTHAAGALVAPFASQGFSRHARVFMMLPLHNMSSQAITLPPEMEIRRWTEHDYQAAATVITAAYRGHVDAEINDQYRTLIGSLRFLNNIVRFPGCGAFDAESSLAIFHRKAKSMVGLVLCSRVRHDVGHITQICVLPEFRAQGIGESLLKAAMNNLHQRGFSQLSLTVTQANEHAINLYRRFGFETLRIFDAFVWEG